MDEKKISKKKEYTSALQATIQLPASKSESNRLLILQALGGRKINIHHLSEARDTSILAQALQNPSTIINLQDAGTAMRFLTAFFCVQQQKKILLGTHRMHQRPISALIEALRKLGYTIYYLYTQGYPPIYISGILKKKIETTPIIISGNQSSQYCSALLMIAPLLSKGLTLQWTKNMVSYPYVIMTLEMMQKCGIIYQKKKHSIYITQQRYQLPSAYTVEADWTSASYWYSFLALHPHPNSQLRLLRLSKSSLQGDCIIAQWMLLFGVETLFEKHSVVLRKIPRSKKIPTINFQNYPDLAPTLLVLWAAKNIDVNIKGIAHLKLKESNRIQVMQTELAKIGATLKNTSADIWKLTSQPQNHKKKIVIYPHDDHRIAMAFTPLMILHHVVIQNPSVVAKSYPHFWQEVKKIQKKI